MHNTSQMLYSQTDRSLAKAEVTKRKLIVFIPIILTGLLSVAIFVWFRLQHDVSGWIYSSLIMIIGGAYGIFFYGVYLKPMLVYRKHVDYMLDGRMRETEGVLKEISSDIEDKEGLDCYALYVNIGQGNHPEDDRLLYLDAQKSIHGLQIGMCIHAESNDKMISNIYKVQASDSTFALA